MVFEIQKTEKELRVALDSLGTAQQEAGLPPELRDDYMEMYRNYLEVSMDNPEFPPLLLGKEGDERVEEETLRIYSRGHQLYYGNDILMLIDELNNWDYAVLICGMYGGKSTIGLTFSDFLKQSDDIDVALYIAGGMEEDVIKSRALISDPERTARPFGQYSDEERDTKIREILERPEQIILLDEYTFVYPIEDVIRLLELAKEYGKKVILLGLDTNYLGIKLDIFNNPVFQTILKDEKRTRVIEGRSYIKNDQRPRLQRPLGKGTIRYLNVGTRENPQYLLDLGIGRLVISKEEKYIRYFPSLNTLAGVFGNHPFFSRVLRETKPGKQTPLSAFQMDFTQHIENNFK